jgi:hypothetical protein
VKELEAAKDTPKWTERYSQFISTVADHLTVFAAHPCIAIQTYGSIAQHFDVPGVPPHGEHQEKGCRLRHASL